MAAFWDGQGKQGKKDDAVEPKKKATAVVAPVKKSKKKVEKPVSFSQAESIEKNIFFPVISEDAMNKQALGKYVFKIHVDANKSEVRKAVQSRFGVIVEKVNIFNMNPKKSFFKGKKGARKRSKKAIVTLAKDQTIEFFSTK